MTTILCWHRPRLRGQSMVCRECAVAIEPCPCDQYRQADSDCVACAGSGWVAIVRGQIAKFKEYAGV